MRILKLASLLLLITFVGTPRHASAAEPVGTIVIAKCPASGPAAVACIGIGVVAYEIIKGDGFGKNGEVMKILRTPVDWVEGNVPAAAQENGDVDKVIRVVSGISVRAINERGILGGDNSELRRLWQGLFAK